MRGTAKWWKRRTGVRTALLKQRRECSVGFFSSSSRRTFDDEAKLSFIRRVLNSRVYEICRETALDPCPILSKKINAMRRSPISMSTSCSSRPEETDEISASSGNVPRKMSSSLKRRRIYLKREDTQVTNGFNVRGAYNKIASIVDTHVQSNNVDKTTARSSSNLPPLRLVAPSAAHHAEGVAYATQKIAAEREDLDIQATLVFPSQGRGIERKNEESEATQVASKASKLVEQYNDRSLAVPHLAETTSTASSLRRRRRRPPPRRGDLIRIAEMPSESGSFEDAQREAERIVREGDDGSTAYHLVHPFDDVDVIAGQATVGAEILRQIGSEHLEAVYAVVGGGGLLSGVAAYVKYVRPEVKVYGVETEDAAPLAASLHVGMRAKLSNTGNWLYPEGEQPNKIGRNNFNMLREHLDGVVTVTTDEVCAAVKDVFDETGTLLDPAGAASVAGMKKREMSLGNEIEGDVAENDDVTTTAIVAICSGTSGGDFNRLRFVAERADDSEAFVAVAIPERAGAFRELYERIWPRNVTEFSYRRRDDPDDERTKSDAHVFVSYQPIGGRFVADDARNVSEELQRAGYEVFDLSQNELAKTHVRYLAGGRASEQAIKHERLFRFEFPEQPGALRRFLENLSEPVHLDFHQVERWDVSIFHYRSHGDDVGRVLAGLLVSPEFDDHLHLFLDRLGYAYTEETENEVYRMFLR